MKADIKDRGCLSGEMLVSFQADELTAEERAQVEEHLKSCRACRDELAGFERLATFLVEDGPEAACDVADAVMSRIAEEERGTAALSITFGWGLLRAAALLAVALLLGVMVSGILDRGAEEGAADTAVTDAARWLVSVQDEDGSWNPSDWGGRKELGASLTGLAMLTIMRSGIEAEDSLKKAENYLASIQNQDGSYGPKCAGSLYNQGIASKAVAELKKSGISSPDAQLQKAMSYIASRQSASGAWSYREADSRNSSVGVSVWQMQALMAGREAGVKGLERGLRNGMAWLNGVYSGTGDFNYRHGLDEGGMSPTVRAMGAMCMLSAQEDILGTADKGRIINDAVNAALSEGNGEDPYRSYFTASAASSSGVEKFSERLAGMRRAIAGKRVTEGINAGSWDDDVKWGSVGGRIFSTSMAALALSNGQIGGIR